ncbi:MAG: CHAT domain-containing tetratricopeptide repeat protein [Bacteroidota bacterium]
MEKTVFVIKYLITSIVIFMVVSSFGQNYQPPDIVLKDTSLIRNYLNKGDIYIYDRTDSALFYYQNALTLSNKSLDSLSFNMQVKDSINHYVMSILLLKATALHYIGIAYLIQGKFKDAIDSFMGSVKYSEITNDKQRTSACFINIGIVNDLLGNFENASEYYLKGLSIKKEINDVLGMIKCYANLGIIYDKQGNYIKALEYVQNALELAKNYGEKEMIAASYNNAGVICVDLKDYSKALEYYNGSLKIFIDLKEIKGESSCYNNIGNIYRITGEYDKAIDNFRMSSYLKEKLGDKNGLALVNSNIASLHILLAGKKRSEVIFSGNEFINHLDSAIYYGTISIDIAKEILARQTIQITNLRLAEAYWGLNKMKESYVFMRNMIENDNEDVLMNFSFLSEAEKENFFSTIKDHYWLFNSFALYYKEIDPSVTVMVYNNTIKNKGLLLKSNTAMRNAVQESKDTILLQKYDEWIDLRKDIARLYSKGENIDEQLKNAEELEEFLVKNSFDFSNFQKIQQISWTDIQKNLNKNEAAIEFLHFPVYYPDSNLADFTESVVYVALIITSESVYPEMIKLFEEKQLEELLKKHYTDDQNYVNELYGIKSGGKHDLYNLIWKPLEVFLKQKNTFYISPSGQLHKISFPALAIDKNNLLCDLYKINLFSGTGKMIDSMDVKFPETISALLFGGINYNLESGQSDTLNKDIFYTDWQYLAGTKDETDMLEKYLKKNKCVISYYSGLMATETEFKQSAPACDLFHFASHGFFFPDPASGKKEISEEGSILSETIQFRGNYHNPDLMRFMESSNPLMRSGLVFAGANKIFRGTSGSDEEDGILTAQEVAHIDMRSTDLVVLSACETGLGDIKGSEGVYGLQRAFKMAGVKYIIMSLWQVPDKETVEFMETFYKKLLKTKDVRLSFNETQKEMRKKYDPYFWAAFVLIE